MFFLQMIDGFSAPSNQCCGSASFWLMWIRIRIRFDANPDPDPDPTPSVSDQIKLHNTSFKRCILYRSL